MSEEALDPVECVRKHCIPDEPLVVTEEQFTAIERYWRESEFLTWYSNIIAVLAMKCERQERTIRDREAELLRCRTHENVAAVTLDKTLNREQRDALKVAADLLAAERQAMHASRWRQVKDEPPPEYTDVLVIYDDKRISSGQPTIDEVRCGAWQNPSPPYCECRPTDWWQPLTLPPAPPTNGDA